LAISTLFAGCAHQRPRVFLLCLLTFHLHLLSDLIGSRGPEVGDLWPICYSEPLFRHPIWFCKLQWKLDGWQNQIIFIALFLSSLWVATKKGFWFVEAFNSRLDARFVSVLRKWHRQLFKRDGLRAP